MITNKMFILIKFIVVLTLFSLSSVQSKLPDDVKKCSPSDKDCILNNINHIMETKLNGDPEFGLINLNPMEVGSMVIKQNENNPININITVKNMVLHGLDQMRAIKIKGFGNSPNGKHEILFKSPSLTLIGDYKINGKILILPVVGEGVQNLTLVEPLTKITFEAKSLIKDGQEYLDVVSLQIDNSIKRFYSHMDNLFNGDKALGDQFNAFTNQEWEALDNEFHQPIVDTLRGPIENAARTVFRTTPYKEIFNISE